VVMVTSFVVIVLVRLLHHLLRLLRWFVCNLRSIQKIWWLRLAGGLLLLLAIPLSGCAFLLLCTILVNVGSTTILTLLFFVGIVGMVISVVVIVLSRLLHLLCRLASSLKISTTWLRHKHKKIDLVEIETDIVEFNVQTEDVDNIETVERDGETRENSPPPNSSAPRRSGRIRKKPDRWSPPSSGCTTRPVPLGSFFHRGVRRSSRIAAARMATSWVSPLWWGLAVVVKL
jgi:hypothetical protein